MVIWITGKGQSGKTTTATLLMQVIPNAVLLDAGEVRRLFPAGFSEEDRYNHLKRMAKFACILEKQNFVPIIAAVSPSKKVRQELRRLFQSSMIIHVPGGKPMWNNIEYQIPDVEEIKNVIEEVGYGDDIRPTITK